MVPKSLTSTPVVLTASDLASLDALLPPQHLHAIAMTVWADLGAGKTYGKKSVLTPNEDDLWNMREYAGLRDTLGGERLGWKLSALSSVGPNHAAVKVVGANALNRHFGFARSSSTILLLDKASMRPLCIMEGTAISAARTGTYASVVADTFFAQGEHFKVFVFGAGPIARWICLMLATIKGQTIDTIWIKTRSASSALAFAQSLRNLETPVTPVDDEETLAAADMVVTASNATTPLFAPADLKSDAVVLHLGGDETPAEYLQAMLRNGTLACDDIAMVSARGTSSLARYFANRNTSLETQAPILGIAPLADLIAGKVRAERPFHITCVGLPSLDLYLALHVYETFLAHQRSRNGSLSDR